MSLNNDVSYVRLNDQDFEFMVVLSNQTDRVAPINKGAINRLVIEENFREWWTKGYLIFDNKHNAFERPKDDDEVEEDYTYRFRNDGNDLLIFRMRPVIAGQASDALTDDIWHIEYAFSIYDIQDITDGQNVDTKFKKLFFWEYDYQLLRQKNVPWSTAEVEPAVAKKPAQASDDDRLVLSGDAIKSLISKGLDHMPQVFSDNWDKGSNKIQYNILASEKVHEALDYMLKHHTASINNDPCFLSRERYSKKWVLQSLSDIFNKAVDTTGPGEYQIEHFFIDSLTEMETSFQEDGRDIVKNPAPYKTPTYANNDLSFERNIQLRDYSIIKSHEFVDMSAMDNMFVLTNTPTYSNDFTDKQFNLEFVDNDVVNIKGFFKRNYTDKLKHAGCDPDPLFTLNKFKNDAVVVHNIYSLASTATDRLADGRNEILKAALLLNQCIVFRAKGMSFRTAGRFIGIDREVGATQNEYDNKLLGQWFVINVKHILVDEVYVNEITAVKVHASAPLNINTAEQYESTN